MVNIIIEEILRRKIEVATVEFKSNTTLVKTANNAPNSIILMEYSPSLILSYIIYIHIFVEQII